MDTLIAVIFAFGIVIGVGALIGLYHAWALTWLWAWFVVPVFGVPELTLWPAFGLFMVKAVLFSKVEPYEETRAIDWSKWVGYLISPLVALGVGYVVRYHLIGG